MDHFPQNLDKSHVFEQVTKYLNRQNIIIKSSDQTRPWGGFLVIEETSLPVFAKLFFPDFDVEANSHLKLSPKILVVQPGKRLSWQYHNRRSELWTIVSGSIGITISDTDRETDAKTYEPGQVISIRQGKRHRAEGLNSWGIVAEIWQHTNPENPSNEEDIIRVQDDFGR